MDLLLIPTKAGNGTEDFTRRVLRSNTEGNHKCQSTKQKFLDKNHPSQGLRYPILSPVHLPWTTHDVQSSLSPDTLLVTTTLQKVYFQDLE